MYRIIRPNGTVIIAANMISLFLRGFFTLVLLFSGTFFILNSVYCAALGRSITFIALRFGWGALTLGEVMLAGGYV